MSNQTQLINCAGCGVHLLIRSDPPAFAPRRRRDNSLHSESSGYLVEGNCPKCGEPFEIWHLVNRDVTHVIDLEHDRPEVFLGKAREQVEALHAERAERAKRIERAHELDLERAAQKLANQQAVLRKRDEERRAREEAVLAKQVTSDDGDWDDYGDDDGGRSPNDDRSDSMNPNNDAYQGGR